MKFFNVNNVILEQVRFFQNLHQSENDLLDKNQLDSLISRLPSAWTNGVKSETPKFQNEKSHSVESSILRKPSVLLSKGSCKKILIEDTE